MNLFSAASAQYKMAAKERQHDGCRVKPAKLKIYLKNEIFGLLLF
jgi:hypothetical protein